MPGAGAGGRTIVTHKQNLLDVTPSDADARLRAFAADVGEPGYRAAQVLRRLWVNPAPTFEAITELPVEFRRRLEDRFEIPRLEVLARQRSADGTEKFLFRLRDGQAIETVAIPEGGRLTLCISSQAGCALQCAFCATGAMGFQRNLDVHEIAGQVREMRLADPPIRITNIVFMGIGARHITVSTVGVLPGIQALAARPEQFRLAISIHAPSDSLRRELMPINTKYPLASVITAAKAFDRRVTFEYVMLGGVNDGVEHALQLAELAKECRAFVNLIPLHPGGTGGFKPTSSDRMIAFARELRSQGVEVATRKSRGLDIAAACGQLGVERLGRGRPVTTDENGDIQ